MPSQQNNIVMQSTRGMFGKQVVFKSRAGKSYVAAPPEVREGRVPTAGQAAVQHRFKAAIAYGKRAIKDPATKKAYGDAATRGQSAFNVATRDAFNPPKVSGIIAQAYKGAVGDALIVQAFDDFKVSAVKVSIHHAAGELIEEGDAVEQGDGIHWIYTVMQPNGSLPGSKIRAMAIDLPGNRGILEIAL